MRDRQSSSNSTNPENFTLKFLSPFRDINSQKNRIFAISLTLEPDISKTTNYPAKMIAFLIINVDMPHTTMIVRIRFATSLAENFRFRAKWSFYCLLKNKPTFKYSFQNSNKVQKYYQNSKLNNNSKYLQVWVEWKYQQNFKFFKFKKTSQKENILIQI